MTDDSKQGFLNTLFQWTVKSTAAESPTTTSEFRPMDDEVRTSPIRIAQFVILFARKNIG